MKKEIKNIEFNDLIRRIFGATRREFHDLMARGRNFKHLNSPNVIGNYHLICLVKIGNDISRLYLSIFLHKL